MAIAYSIIFVLSLLLPLCYHLFMRKQREDPWLLLFYISVCVVNMGYLLLSVSKTVEFALAANKISYLGQVLVPLCMFMIISELCGITYKRWVKYALFGMAVVMFGLVLTTGHLDWYYKSVELVQADGAAKLVKEYGVLHPINLIYVISYFAAMLIVIGTSIRKSDGKSQKLVGLMVAVVIGNIGIWIVGKLVTLNFEFLSISYLMCGFVFLFGFWMLQDYIHVTELPTHAIVEEKAPIIVVDTMTRAEKVQVILATLPKEATLSARQMEILEHILDGKSRKEIAAELHISENTVKTHMSMLYKVLGVSGREEIHALFKK